MSREEDAAVSPQWNLALLAAAMIAVDPRGLCGVRLRARAGEVRDRWLEELGRTFGPDVPWRRLSSGTPEARLAGGLDIGATLMAGRSVVERGVLPSADGGVVVLAMAERAGAGFAATIGAALDEGEVRIERDGISTRLAARIALIALDEGIDDETIAAPLADRLGLCVDLSAIAGGEAAPQGLADVAAARALLARVTLPDDMVQALCAVAAGEPGISMRRTLHLMRAARAAAALAGREVATPEDAEMALRLVLGLSAAPAAEEEGEAEETEAPDTMPEPPVDTPDPEGEGDDTLSAEALKDMLVEAVAAELPTGLLSGLSLGTAPRGDKGPSGKAGAVQSSGTRGRAIGTASRPPVPSARLDVLATLRQAAPWQKLRAGRETPGRLKVLKSDFRYLRHRERRGTTAIFAVDASGSAAVERLAETKGAIELLLADCYVRRDSVALIAFRGRAADMLLAPTRSLVKAKRSLSALPGGGGTPLAGGILAALELAEASVRKGQSVVTVFLTDGRGNVALDGTTARELVEEDTRKAARLFRGRGLRSIVIDTARRPQARAQTLGRDLGAEYLALPRGGAGAMAREVGARMEG